MVFTHGAEKGNQKRVAVAGDLYVYFCLCSLVCDSDFGAFFFIALGT